MHDPVDAPEPDRRLEFVLLDVSVEIFGLIGDILHDAPVHVYYVEGSVRGGEEVHRTEAFIGGSQKLTLGVGVAGLEAAASVVVDDQAMDQVRGRIGDEGVALEFLGQAIAPEDIRIGGGRVGGGGTVFA